MKCDFCRKETETRVKVVGWLICPACKERHDSRRMATCPHGKVKAVCYRCTPVEAPS